MSNQDAVANNPQMEQTEQPEQEKKGWFSDSYIIWWIIGCIIMKYVFEYMGWLHH